MQLDPCELCATPSNTVHEENGTFQKCPRCGDFRTVGFGLGQHQLSDQDKIKLSAWVREQNYLKEVPTLTADLIKVVSASPFPGISDRANRLLTWIVRNRKFLNEKVDATGVELIAITHCYNAEELGYLLRFCVDRSWIEGPPFKQTKILASGYIRYEEIQTKQSSSTQGFVAMWFDKSLDKVFSDGFWIGIHEAGYNPVRIDTVEHSGKIDDEIIAQIRQSRFVVADFTGHRGGVYFEAGFALGLGLPVIWTCRKDDLTNLHFDTRQFNFIDWSDNVDLAKRLQKRIEAVIGRGTANMEQL